MHVFVSLRETLVSRRRKREEERIDHLKYRPRVFVNVWCGPFKRGYFIIWMREKEDGMENEEETRDRMCRALVRVFVLDATFERCASDPDLAGLLDLPLPSLLVTLPCFLSHASRDLTVLIHPSSQRRYALSMASRLAPVTKPIFRAQLSSKPSNGHASFIPQISKLVFEYSQNWSSSTNTRTFLQNNLQNLARANPHVQLVVKQRNNRQPIVRGLYRASFSYFGLLLSTFITNIFCRIQSITRRRSFL
jgi:hypothetical protein